MPANTAKWHWTVELSFRALYHCLLKETSLGKKLYSKQPTPGWACWHSIFQPFLHSSISLQQPQRAARTEPNQCTLPLIENHLLLLKQTLVGCYLSLSCFTVYPFYLLQDDPYFTRFVSPHWICLCCCASAHFVASFLKEMSLTPWIHLHVSFEPIRPMG